MNLFGLLIFIGIVVLLFIVLAVQVAENKKSTINKIKNGFGKEADISVSESMIKQIQGYFDYHNPSECIDDITWSDLNLWDFYKKYCSCFSSAGKEYFYYLLKHPFDREVSAALEDASVYFEKNESVRTDASYMLCCTGSSGKYSAYSYLNKIKEFSPGSNVQYIIRDLLLVISVVCMLFFTIPGLIFLLVILFANAYKYLNIRHEYGEINACSKYLYRLCKNAKELNKTELPDTVGKVFNIDESIDNSLSAFKGCGIAFGKMGSSGNPFDLIMDYLKMFTFIDVIYSNRIIANVLSIEQDIDACISYVGFIDASICVASFRKSLDYYCKPQFTDNNSISVTGMYHPLLKKPVTNDFDTNRCVLLTGSNASGKSTFLRGMALLVLLGEAFNTCPAESAIIPPVHIFSSISVSDSLLGSESCYIAEVKSIKRIIDHDGPTICFIDEPLKGTNTIERIAAGKSILKYLSDNNVICFAATHDIELTNLLSDCFSNYHFDEEVSENGIHFSYKIKNGPATSKNAIKLLEFMNYPEIIYKDAIASME